MSTLPASGAPATPDALLAEAGHPNGFETEMVSYVLPQWGASIQAYLQAVGVARSGLGNGGTGATTLRVVFNPGDGADTVTDALRVNLRQRGTYWYPADPTKPGGTPPMILNGCLPTTTSMPAALAASSPGPAHATSGWQ